MPMDISTGLRLSCKAGCAACKQSAREQSDSANSGSKQWQITRSTYLVQINDLLDMRLELLWRLELAVDDADVALFVAEHEAAAAAGAARRRKVREDRHRAVLAVIVTAFPSLGVAFAIVLAVLGDKLFVKELESTPERCHRGPGGSKV